MNLARHSISSTTPILIFDARFDSDCNIFTATTPAGFAIYRAWPLKLIRVRELTGGTLAAAVPMHSSNLMFLLGGGRSPRYPPNKVIVWDDAIGAEVAELEFRERVRGVACRRGWLAVALKRRVVLFEIGEYVTRYAEYDTCDNSKGLLSMATAQYATLLCIPGRQLGHVHLIHLPPCPPPRPSGPPPSVPPSKPPPPTKHPASIIAAHSSALTTLSVPPSGRILATTSSRGTLVRVWDVHTGKPIREFRRGADKAEIFGVAFRPDEKELCVWSDKGTVHAFALDSSGASNRQSSFSPLAPFIPLPKYFDSEWSYAQYRIPAQSSHISISSPGPRSPTEDVADEEKCIVGWIKAPLEGNPQSPLEYQLIALTYTGGWYRLSLPNTRASSGSARPSSPLSGAPASSSPPKSVSMPPLQPSSASSFTGRTEKGKGREKDRERDSKESGGCVLQEFRRFGRWDGWG
ncbi:hypothetical protein PLICRDRAFT_48193 [Plicaturopsis crispa FD-325 SS-3]|nr:hypothetical protein PLICRDRAFT_48193 [Plicaturopsis crispa FD-325 SS-3]